jgi:hypothetical protein
MTFYDVAPKAQKLRRGFVEEQREGQAANQRFLRLTEKGRRAADGGRY